ncbi:MAG: hypothetical protein CMK00_09295 [Planctomycetes bacterium]|nr:hypothetical protein [Planctomycetota bacterium]
MVELAEDRSGEVMMIRDGWRYLRGLSWVGGVRYGSARQAGLLADKEGRGRASAGQASSCQGQDQVPCGDGLRCVAGPFLRLAPVMAVEDVLRSPVNLSAAPLAGQVLCGSSWYFQAWFREPETVGSGGAGFNLSSGLEVAFTP